MLAVPPLLISKRFSLSKSLFFPLLFDNWHRLPFKVYTLKKKSNLYSEIWIVAKTHNNEIRKGLWSIGSELPSPRSDLRSPRSDLPEASSDLWELRRRSELCCLLCFAIGDRQKQVGLWFGRSFKPVDIWFRTGLPLLCKMDWFDF